jgi:hypothetical protein
MRESEEVESARLFVQCGATCYSIDVTDRTTADAIEETGCHIPTSCADKSHLPTLLLTVVDSSCNN